MELENARLVYVPFKRIPAGHMFIIFTFTSGEEIAVSPEADLKEDLKFSLLRGMGKTYPLCYRVQHPSIFFDRYRLEGRRAEEYMLRLSTQQLKKLYAAMMTRAHELRQEQEWYHTLVNSCVTNTMNHLDDIQAVRRSWIRYGGYILAARKMVQ